MPPSTLQPLARYDANTLGPKIEAMLGYQLRADQLDAVVSAFIGRKAEFAGEHRLDANETAILGPLLTQVRGRINQRKRQELKGERFVPVTHELDPGAETFIYHMWDATGMAEMITNPADDISKVATSAEEFTHKTVDFAKAYDISQRDIERATFSGVPLRANKMAALDQAFALRHEVISAVGVEGTALTGLLNHANVPVIASVAAAAGGNSPIWGGADKTPLEVVDDLLLLEDTIDTQTNGVERADTLLLPKAKMNYIRRTPIYTGAGSNVKETILTTFLHESEGITDIDHWRYCVNADAAGTGPRACMYKRDPRVVHHEVPRAKREYPPQVKNLVLEVIADMVSAAVWWEYPLAGAYMDGI